MCQCPLSASSFRCRAVPSIVTGTTFDWQTRCQGVYHQYEANIDGEWHEIVRYDTAHGRPHKDVLHPGGAQTKEEFPYYTHAEVLTFGQNDIRRNWKKYRAQYEKEMRKRS